MFSILYLEIAIWVLSLGSSEVRQVSIILRGVPFSRLVVSTNYLALSFCLVNRWHKDIWYQLRAASYQTQSTTIPIKLTLYQRFFEAAKLDMASAKILTEKDLYQPTIYHLQQAYEKCIKS